MRKHRTSVFVGSFWLRGIAFAALAMGSLGCATMSLEPQPSTERVLATRQAPESTERFVPHVTQDGAVVHLQLDSECQVRSYNRVETTGHLATVNKSAWLDWTFGVAGGGLVGLGIWGLVDSSSTFSNDTTSRTYNSVGQGKEQGLAIASLVSGGALLAVATIDVIRAQRWKDTVSYGEQAGAVVGICPPKPLEGATIAGKVDQGNSAPFAFGFGSTNSAGALDIDLGKIVLPVPANMSGEPYGSNIAISANGIPAGNASLSGAYAVWRQAWQGRRNTAAESSTALMAEAKRSQADKDSATLSRIATQLASVESAANPWSANTQSTYRECLNSVDAMNRDRPKDQPIDPRLQDALHRLHGLEGAVAIANAHNDDVAWAEARAQCLRATSLDGCLPVDQYRRDFPNGRHVAEANQLEKTPRVQQFINRATAEQEAQKARARQNCDSCVSTCVGSTGKSESECRTQCSSQCPLF